MDRALIRTMIREELGDLETLVRQLQGKRAISGRVSSTGAILAGEGFTVSKLGTGQYRIDYDEPFAEPPAVTATGQQIVYENSSDETFVRLHTFTDAGVAADALFSFDATGIAG